MPAIEQADLDDIAVYWEAQPGVNDENGNPVVLPPVEIDCRWVTKRKQSIDPKGNFIGLEATVAVDFKVPIGSHLWHGTLIAWYAEGGSDGRDDELMTCVSNSETPDTEGREVRYKAMLMRYRDTAPGH